MHSMTAFGRGEATNGETTVVVELRSVNHRFRDVHIRAPREYSSLEPRVVSLLRERVDRGRLDCTIRRRSREGPMMVVPDLRLAESCFVAMRDIAHRLQRPEEEVTLALVLAQPGVLSASEEVLDATHEWEVLEPALEGALNHMLDMRRSEGQALREDLGSYLGDLSAALDTLRELSGKVAGRLYQRLRERLEAMLADSIDPHRLAQEAAILAEKADISEELSRLASHVQQCRELFDVQGPVGRKMEFLVQEMGRELNTVGAKAAIPEAGRLVVDMKSIVEKIREQAANIE